MSAICRFILPIILGLWVLPGYAQGFKGIDLYKACYGVLHNPADEAVCLGYIRGFSEGAYLFMYLGEGIGKSGKRTCFPTPATSDPIDPTQAELIIKKFLANNPNRLHEPAAILAQDAFIEAFRCRPAGR